MGKSSSLTDVYLLPTTELNVEDVSDFIATHLPSVSEGEERRVRPAQESLCQYILSLLQFCEVMVVSRSFVVKKDGEARFGVLSRIPAI